MSDAPEVYSGFERAKNAYRMVRQFMRELEENAIA